MSTLTWLGKAFAIEYEVSKKRDRVEHIYRHEFENRADVYTNGSDIIVHGKFLKVTKRGIEG